jgi:hypothetical protein
LFSLAKDRLVEYDLVGKTCADGGGEGLQHVYSAVEEFHYVDFLLLFWEKKTPSVWDGVSIDI